MAETPRNVAETALAVCMRKASKFGTRLLWLQGTRDTHSHAATCGIIRYLLLVPPVLPVQTALHLRRQVQRCQPPSQGSGQAARSPSTTKKAPLALVLLSSCACILLPPVHTSTLASEEWFSPVCCVDVAPSGNPKQKIDVPACYPTTAKRIKATLPMTSVCPALLYK